MGTYRQPSQILDERVGYFRKGFKETTAMFDAKKKLEYQRQAKQKKEDASLAIKQKKKQGNLLRTGAEMNAEIGAFSDDQGILGYDLVKTEGGTSKLVKVSDAQRELLKKIHSSTKGDYDNDPATPDTYRTNYKLTEEEKALIDDQKYSTRRLVYDKDKNKLLKQETNLSQFYENELEAGHGDPFGLGIKGSIETQIRSNYNVMGYFADDPDNINYITAHQNIKTGIEQYNNFEAVMQENSEQLKGILDSDGNVQSLDREGAVLMSKDPQFMLNFNASIDYMTGNNKYRFDAVLDNGEMTVNYRNNSISDVTLKIPYNGLIGNVKKKGFGLVKTTQQKPVELMYDYIQAGVKEFYKPITRREKNTYYVGKKKITESEAVEVWEVANEKMREFVQNYFYGKDRDGESTFTKDPNAQNNWQMLGGANSTGNIFWGDNELSEKQVKEQQDFMVNKVINHMQVQYGADMGSNKGDISTTYTELKEISRSNKKLNQTEKKVDYYRNENIKIEGFENEGFKRASGKYTFPEIKQNYAKLARSPKKYAEFLNYLGGEYGDSKKVIDYYTGIELNKMNKQWNIDNKDGIDDGDEEAAQTDLNNKAVYAQPASGKPYEVGNNWIKLSHELRKIFNITQSAWEELQKDAADIDSTDDLTREASAEDLYDMLTTA